MKRCRFELFNQKGKRAAAEMSAPSLLLIKICAGHILVSHAVQTELKLHASDRMEIPGRDVLNENNSRTMFDKLGRTSFVH